MTKARNFTEMSNETLFLNTLWEIVFLNLIYAEMYVRSEIIWFFLIVLNMFFRKVFYWLPEWLL